MKLNDYQAVPDRYTGIIDRPSGRTWWVDGKLHRTDGPAWEEANGYRAWYVDDKRHRTDGPARECANGDNRSWWVDDKRHRTEGPAVERANGYKAWWVEGKLISVGTSILLVMYYEA